jgi:hypothetical protein
MNCAIELVHHFRKSGAVEPTADDVRGASSIVGAGRSVRILAGMSKDQADAAGVGENRMSFFSVSFGKANLFPRTDNADWFQLVGVSLGNGGSRPHDEIGVSTQWKWPNAFDGLHVSDLDRVQDKIASGEWAENVQASDWAGHAVAEVLGLDVDGKADKGRIKSPLKTWIKNGALKVESRYDAKKGRDKPMIIVGSRS